MDEDLNQEVTCYNEWFISAIKSSKVDGEIQEKLLLSNCINCSNQVKSAINSNESLPSLKYEEFRLDSTILLLLGCPSVNSSPDIASSEDFIPLIKSIPTIDEQKLFVALKGLKNYKYLRGILPFLTVEVSNQLLDQFLHQNKTITPLSLAIGFEIFYAIIYSLQFEVLNNEEFNQTLKSFQAFLKSIHTGFDSIQDNKLRAYHFMYCLEVCYLLFSLLQYISIEEPCTASLGRKFSILKSDLKREMLHPSLYPILIHNLCNLLSICNDIVVLITSNIWISWYSIKPPGFGFLTSYTENEEENCVKGIQMQIAFTSFKVLKCLKSEELEDGSIPQNTYKELKSFLEHVAVDPSYDSDIDLSNSEIVGCIKNASKAKVKKLVNILLSREDIFNSDECLQCLEEHQDDVPVSVIPSLTKRLIGKLNEDGSDHILGKWKRVVVKLCRKLSQEQMLNIIEDNLHRGTSCCLKTPEFIPDLTQIFNQLSDHPNIECYDSFVWLCLQSGSEVVSSSVEMALSLPGLVPVVVPGLRLIYAICRSKTTGNMSLLTSLIDAKFSSNLTAETEKELRDLTLSLLKGNPTDNQSSKSKHRYQDTLPIDLLEAFQKIVCPRLQCGVEIEAQLLMPIEILEVMMQLYPDVICNSGPELASLLVSLSLIHHNCCVLSSANFNLHLNVRSAVERILRLIIEEINHNRANYCKDITMFCVLLDRYDNWHPRSLYLLRPLVDPAEGKDPSVADELFSLILQKSSLGIKGHLPDCSRIEWIWSLHLLLPDCDEEEWLESFHLTFSFLNCAGSQTCLVTPVLKIFQEVFILWCDGEKLNPAESGGRDLALHHCFKAFSCSAVKFISHMLQEDEKPFFTVVNALTWWCLVLNTLNCSPELPYLLVNLLCTSLNDLVKSKAVVIKSSKKKQKPPPRAEGKSMEEAAGCRETVELGVRDPIELDPVEVAKEEGTAPSIGPGSPPEPPLVLAGEGSEDTQETPSEGKSLALEPQAEERNGGDSFETKVFNTMTQISDDNPPPGAPGDAQPTSDNTSGQRRQVITREKFNRVMEELVAVFVNTLIPNKMAATVAAKLKNLCEM